MQTFADTKRLIRADVAWRCEYEQKPFGRSTVWRLMLHPGSLTVILFRWQTYFDLNGLRAIGALLRWLNLVLFTSNYSSKAQIAGGLMVVHAVAVTIDDDVVIGPRCTMFMQNFIGRSRFADGSNGSGAPVVDSNVTFGIGASAHGPIHIGAGCRIGMNTLVDTTVAPGSTLLGTPARVTGVVQSPAT